MKTGKVYKEFEKAGLKWICDKEVLTAQAKEKGLDEITDELVIAELKHQFENVEGSMYFSILFNEDDAEDEPEEYKERKKEYNAMKRKYNKYCN